MIVANHINSFRRLAVVAAILLLAGCSTDFFKLRPQTTGAIAERKIAAAQEPEVDGLGDRNLDIRRKSDAAVMNVPPRAGSGVIGEIDLERTVDGKRSAANGKSAGKGGPSQHLRLEFTDTSLKDIIVVFLQDYLKVPYSFADGFKDKKANLYFDAEASREELLALFDSLLDNYGVRLRYTGTAYIITSQDDKSPAGPPSPLGVGDAVGLLRLRYVDAKDFVPLAKQVVRDQNKVTALGNNGVIVSSTSADARAVALLAQDIDVPVFSGKKIIIYVPKYLTANGLVAMMDNYQNQLMGGQQGGARQFESKQIIDSDRIVIVAASASARDIVVEFLTRADVPDNNKRQVFQFVLGTQPAADVATNLTTMLKAVFKNVSEIAVVPDKSSNSLFIFASPDEYAEIRRLLERMDNRPPAVHIDMSIVEVRLNDSLQYGVDWYLRKKGFPLFEISNDQKLSLTKGLRLAALGNSDSVNFAVLELLASETSFSLLSSPQLVVKNGATAKISAATEQPIVKGKVTTGAQVQGSTAISSEVVYQKIGLELEVTPFVSGNNEVRMIVKLKDSTLSGSVKIDGNDYPQLSTRELATELVTADRQTIFIGGIRRQTQNETRSKIPGLGDIEAGGLGAIFGNKSESNDGSELIILARPSIMLDQQGVDIITRSVLRAASENFKPFTEQSVRIAPAGTPGVTVQPVPEPAKLLPSAVGTGS
jgi:type II secretory pathway component GspD/PulD (secretin)